VSGYLRTELWTDLACDGGTRVALMVPPYWRAPQVSRTVRGEGSCTISGDGRWPDLAELRLGRVVRIQMETASEFEEWRIRDVTVENSGTEQRVTVLCDDPLADLLRVPWVETDAAGVPYHQLLMAGTTAELVVDGELLPKASAAGFDWIAKGTIDPTQVFDLDVQDANGASIIAALQEPSRAPCEVQLRRNGTTNYLLDLLDSIGAAADPLYLRTGRNLERGSRALRGSEALTRARGKGASNGAHAGIAFAYWRVSAVDTITDKVTLEDPRGAPYPGPIGFDDQLNGLRVARLVSTYADVEVLDSSAAAQTITVADASPFSVGDLVEFRVATGVSGQRLDRLSNPAGEALYGAYTRLVERELINCQVNYVPNPWFSTWSSSGSPPDGWSRTVSGSVTSSRNTTDGRFGPYAWNHLSASGAGQLRLDSPAFKPYTGGSYNFWCWLYVTGLTYAGGTYSDPLVKLQIRDASTNSVLHEVEFNFVDGSDFQGVDQWLKLEIGAPDLSSATNGVYLTFLFTSVSGGTSWAYNTLVDAFGCAPAINGTVDVEGPGANDLWHALNSALLNPWPAEWRVDAIDLEQIDGAAFPFDKVTLGQLVYITDTQLGLTTTQRLLGYQRDYDPSRPNIELELGRLQTTLTDLLAPRPALPIGAIARQIAEQLANVLPEAAPTEQETLNTVVVGLRGAFRSIT
jgi:hypothetical protein